MFVIQKYPLFFARDLFNVLHNITDDFDTGRIILRQKGGWWIFFSESLLHREHPYFQINFPVGAFGKS